MYFWDEKKQEAVEKCPGCQADFVLGKGAGCLSSCLAKKLEVKHRKIVSKIIKFCLDKQKLKIEHRFHLPAEMINEKGWGWTDDVRGMITIPWWTLRSEKEFFDTNPHEVGHITAYQKKFTLIERNILKKLALFEEKRAKAFYNNDFNEFIATEWEITKIKRTNEKLVKKYSEWEGHDYNPWYLEYLKFHKKLVNSSFVKYAYGDTKPRSHGFDKQGKGQYKPKYRNLKLKN